MLWLIVTIFSYLISAVVFLIDKYLLTGPISNPKIYAFYIGVLGSAVVLFLPFTDFYVLEPLQLLLAFISGASFILAILWFFKGLKLFDSSRIVPAIGGILPIFTFLLVYLSPIGQELPNLWEITAFLLLVLGSFLITYEKSKQISFKSLKISTIAAFLFALSFVTAKYVYLEYPFLLGLFWIKIGGVLMALIFLFSRSLRNELFKQKMPLQKKTAVVFLLNQIAGALAGILQNWAIALAPLVYIAFVNALQGIQYVFLLILAALISLKFPKVLKEQMAREVILQKIIAILVIAGGLVILSLK